MARDTDRIIGSLEEFKKSVEKRLDEIEREVKALNHFKWKVVGGTSILSMILAAGFEVLKAGPHLPWKGN